MWGLVSSAANRVATAFASRDRFPNRNDADTAGPARNTAKTARLRALRLSERETLIAEIQHRRRQHRATCSLERRLRRLTAELAADV